MTRSLLLFAIHSRNTGFCIEIWMVPQRVHYAASRKVAGSSPDEVDFLNWPNTYGRTGPGVDSASNINEYHESLKNKETWG
jgi:hypothetical protein